MPIEIQLVHRRPNGKLIGGGVKKRGVKFDHGKGVGLAIQKWYDKQDGHNVDYEVQQAERRNIPFGKPK